MANLEELIVGTPVALKPTEDALIPAVHGKVSGFGGGRVRVHVAGSSATRLKPYDPGLRCAMVWESEGRGAQTSVVTRSRNGAELEIEAETSREKRAFPRVRASASFNYEILSDEQAQRAAVEILNTVTGEDDEPVSVERFWHSADDDVWEKVDEEFGRVMRQIAEVNAKMDYLIALAEGSEKPRAVRRHREIDDFSGSGLGFLEEEALPMDAILRMTIELSRFPRLVVHCLGKVVRCDPCQTPGDATPREFSIGVHFDTISETDRERIIRYVFKIQRRLLRNRKDAATA